MKAENFFLNCHTEESISIRYKSLAKKWHPDVNKLPEATEVFQEIQKQRENAVTNLMRKHGKSEGDIHDYIQALKKRDKKAQASIIDSMANDLAKKFENSEKPPTFMDALKMVLDGFNKKNNPNNQVSGNNSSNQKKID